MKTIFILMGIIFSIYIHAHEETTQTQTVSLEEILGLSENQIKLKYPQTRELSRSFVLLASKNLFPYRLPESHKLLRFGNSYLLFELKDDKVINIHKVRG